jgi:hypothetical protein
MTSRWLGGNVWVELVEEVQVGSGLKSCNDVGCIFCFLRLFPTSNKLRYTKSQCTY